MDLEYRAGGLELLDHLAHLWLGLIEHHAQLDPRFAAFTRSRNWESRKSGLLNKAAGGALRTEIAYIAGEPAAYSIATIDGQNIGEIDSIFVNEAWRGNGIGRELVLRALKWLSDEGSVLQKIAVREGNDRALQLYKSCGFEPLMTILAQIPQ